jgi:hypothetical protein
MTQLIHLPKDLEGVPPEERGRWCCARLEEGNILSTVPMLNSEIHVSASTAVSYV